MHVVLNILIFPEAQGGILLFLQTGSNVAVTEAWEDSSLSHPMMDTDKHNWSVREIIQDGGDFRSHVIDQLTERTVTKVLYFRSFFLTCKTAIA